MLWSMRFLLRPVRTCQSGVPELLGTLSLFSLNGDVWEDVAVRGREHPTRFLTIPTQVWYSNKFLFHWLFICNWSPRGSSGLELENRDPKLFGVACNLKWTLHGENLTTQCYWQRLSLWSHLALQYFSHSPSQVQQGPGYHREGWEPVEDPAWPGHVQFGVWPCHRQGSGQVLVSHQQQTLARRRHSSQYLG